MNTTIDNLVRIPLRVTNPNPSALKVWLEPWAEQHELAQGESLDLVFVGTAPGYPEVTSDVNAVSLHGWEGSEVFAFRNGRLATEPPLVEEIIRQELAIAHDRVAPTSRSWADGLAPYIGMCQKTLDGWPQLNEEAQRDACELAAILAWELARTLTPSSAASTLSWQVARRVVATKALVLADSQPASKEKVFQSESPKLLTRLILQSSVSALPDQIDSRSLRLHEPPAKPPSGQAESDQTSK